MRIGIMLRKCPSTNWLLITGRAQKAALEILAKALTDGEQKNNYETIKKLEWRIKSGDYDLQIHGVSGEKDWICITSDLLPPPKKPVFVPALSIYYTKMRILAVRVASLFT